MFGLFDCLYDLIVNYCVINDNCWIHVWLFICVLVVLLVCDVSDWKPNQNRIKNKSASQPPTVPLTPPTTTHHEKHPSVAMENENVMPSHCTPARAHSLDLLPQYPITTCGVQCNTNARADKQIKEPIETRNKNQNKQTNEQTNKPTTDKQTKT